MAEHVKKCGRKRNSGFKRPFVSTKRRRTKDLVFHNVQQQQQQKQQDPD
jgi:ribosomal protein L28